MVSGFLTRDRTRAPCTGWWIRKPLDHRESPRVFSFDSEQDEAIAGCGAGERYGLFQFQLHHRAAGGGQAGRGSGRDGAGAGRPATGRYPSGGVVVWGQGRSSGGATEGLDSVSVLEVL